MARAFAWIVGAMLREFHTEAVKGTLVQASEKTFHHLTGVKFQLTEGLNMLLLDGHDGQGTYARDRSAGDKVRPLRWKNAQVDAAPCADARDGA